MNAKHVLRNLVLCLFFIYASASRTLCQPLIDSTSNFFNLTSYYDQYYDSLAQIRGIENMHGTGYKQYLRWKWFCNSRHDENGYMGPFWAGLNEYHDNFQVPFGYMDVSDWRFTGPKGVPLGHNGAPANATGKGMIISLWVGSGNHSLIYAGSHHGGLWKTTDGGQSWSPLHDNDARIHGVNSIAVDPQNPNTIYIACDNSMEKFSTYSAGLFKSNDAGETFDSLVLPGLNYPTDYWAARLKKILIPPESPGTLFVVAYRKMCTGHSIVELTG